MGDVTIENGFLVHEGRTYGGEDCGRVFECHHIEEATVRVDGHRVILHIGGMSVSMPSDVVTELLERASLLTPEAVQAKLADELRIVREKHERERDAEQADQNVEMERLQAKRAAMEASFANEVREELARSLETEVRQDLEERIAAEVREVGRD